MRNVVASLVQRGQRQNHAAHPMREVRTKATILDQTTSESLRRQMAERVQNDTRLIDLMGKLGACSVTTNVLV